MNWTALLMFSFLSPHRASLFAVYLFCLRGEPQRGFAGIRSFDVRCDISFIFILIPLSCLIPSYPNSLSCRQSLLLT